MQVSNFVPTVNEAAATYKGKRKVNSVEKKKEKENRKIRISTYPDNNNNNNNNLHLYSAIYNTL